MNVNLDLVKKYDRPGPRYTSYPTAPHFTELFGVEDWDAAVRSNNVTGERDLSLYFHFPFCDTLCWFCGCTMMVARQREPIARYVEYILREIDMVASRLHPGRRVVQIHFGGGTPTHLSPDEIRRVGHRIRERFDVSPEAEIGCEMDPRGLKRAHVEALREVGFNRASLGIQDFDPVVQKAVNRIHDETLVGRVIDWIRELGFDSLNLDLIYGLPHQSVESFARTLDAVNDFRPDRLAVFSYAHVPWMKAHQKLIREEDLPAPEEKLSMLKEIVETLTAGDFAYVGMDHFARDDDTLTRAQRNGTLQRNFQGYSTHDGTDIYALGLSGISQLPRCYSQRTKDLNTYYACLDDGRPPVERGVVLTQDDAERRHLIMRLMCDMSLDIPALSETFGYDVATRYADELQGMRFFMDDGLLKPTPSGFEVTSSGRLFVRNIAMKFDAYLKPSHAGFSRTV